MIQEEGRQSITLRRCAEIYLAIVVVVGFPSWVVLSILLSGLFGYQPETGILQGIVEVHITGLVVSAGLWLREKHKERAAR